jgi:hypothetical protein
VTTAAEYNSFAQDCMRWAKEAKDASQRDILIGTARLWAKTALRLEWHITMAANKTLLFKELRSMLD